jgi:trehalose/maltose hydrolase-like predicted phosphorylase
MMASWQLAYNEYKPDEEALREALCTLGNGYFATRGAGAESTDDGRHYPGTYLAGGYNRLHSEIAGKTIENEDLVNFPNWLVMNFKPENGDWFSLDKVQILDFEQKLNIREGVLERNIRFKDRQDRETLLKTRRFVHMLNKHMAGIQWKLTAINWSGKIMVRSGIDGSVSNNGVKRYRDLNSNHLKILDLGRYSHNSVFLKSTTLQSEIVMAQSARLKMDCNGKDLKPDIQIKTEEKKVLQEAEIALEQGKEMCFEKIVALYTSRDKAIADIVLEANNALERAPSFDKLLESQRTTWEAIWHRADTQIDAGNDQEQMILRLHIFHIFQTASLNTIDQDVGIPSRGWHGEAYRGHILWDELFIFPFLMTSLPELTRSLLMYRFRRLPEARHNAQSNGYQGAMFPWQSGSNGREESQHIHLNPASGNWIPDDTYLQRHVNLAIAYNVWKYFEISSDHEFMSFYGAELILDIAQFWASKTKWNDNKNKYEITGVVGPDEYHTSYPNSENPGIDNNAYTNIMAVWVFRHALKTLETISKLRCGELLAKLEISNNHIERWKKISSQMYVPFIENSKIISQFEGFEGLEELDWKKYHDQYGEVLRLDRIMEKENDNVNKYKAVKQADVLMLFYLFSASELEELFKANGYDFNRKHIPNNIQYYNERTSHGSTLSQLIHSWAYARSNRGKSWYSYQKALISDVKDIQGGTTSEGIHLGAMAGTVDLIQRCYTGIEFRDNCIKLNPRMPEELKSIAFKIRYRGRWIELSLNHTSLTLKCMGGWSKNPVDIYFGEKKSVLGRGEEKSFAIKK